MGEKGTEKLTEAKTSLRLLTRGTLRRGKRTPQLLPQPSPTSPSLPPLGPSFSIQTQHALLAGLGKHISMLQVPNSKQCIDTTEMKWKWPCTLSILVSLRFILPKRVWESGCVFPWWDLLFLFPSFPGAPTTLTCPPVGVL